MEEKYIVSARKYRPSTFSSVVGQKALTATLRNAIATDRLAHAYLFCGSRGVGKTSCARIFAKSINCANPTPDGDPCNECPSCRAFNENRSLNIIELDAASNNGVEDIRSLTDQVQIPPTEGKYRVFIIDEVHMLSSAAFNAFLKTLEEPPSYVIFILATTEKHKIIPTILSRCQIYDFARITVGDITDHLAYVAQSEGIKAERPALGVIARKADGAMRDALSIFDQVAASSRGDITYRSAVEALNVLDERYYSRLFDAFRAGDVPAALLVYKEVRDRGFDSLFFVNGLASYLRDLMVAREPKTLSLLDTDDETRAAMAAQGALLDPEFFYSAMSLCNEADMAYRAASSKTFLVELLLIRLCQLTGPSPISDGSGEGRVIKKIEPASPSASVPQPSPVFGGAPASRDAACRVKVENQQDANQQGIPADYTRHAASLQPGVVGLSEPRRAASPSPSVSSSPVQASQRRPGPRLSHTPSMRDALADRTPAGQPATEQAAASRVNRQPFADDALLAIWSRYAAERPRQHLLVNTMRQSVPARQNPQAELFTVTVENQGQVELLTAEMPELLRQLRSELANDFIELRLTVSDKALAPTAWNDRDLLAHLVETHPQTADFIRALKLSL